MERIVAEFNDYRGREVRITTTAIDYYMVYVDGKRTQEALYAEDIIRWLANANHVE